MFAAVFEFDDPVIPHLRSCQTGVVCDQAACTYAVTRLRPAVVAWLIARWSRYTQTIFNAP